jgi:hypothetical protein
MQEKAIGRGAGFQPAFPPGPRADFTLFKCSRKPMEAAQISNLPSLKPSEALDQFQPLQNGILRDGKLKICATATPALG